MMKIPQDLKPGISRRAMVTTGALAVGAVVTGEALGQQRAKRGAPQTRVTSQGGVAHLLSENHWGNLVGQEFVIKGTAFEEPFGEGVPIVSGTKLRLVETHEAIPAGKDEARPNDFHRRFATVLTFVGPPSLASANCTYRVFHPWLEEFELSLDFTELQRYRRENVYVAVINN